MTQNLTTEHPSSPPPGPTAAAATRLPHLDALRGGALLLGVLLHALMPFLPGNLWLVDDSQDSWAAEGAVAVIHLFRMILFMMLAGYFGHMVLQRRGTWRYLRDRLTRIGLPLIGFWPGLFALMLGALILNEVVRGPGAATEAPEATGGPTGFLALPTMHLWFLLLLLEIVLVVVAVRSLLIRVLGAERAGRLAHRIGTLLSSRVGVVLVAVPYAVGVSVQGVGRGSITEPYTLVPVAGASIAYSGAFLAGWFLRANPEALGRVQRQWIPQLALAAVLTVVALLLPPSAPAVLAAAASALAGWAWVYGLLGLAARLVTREIPVVRYLADASYWVYLLHFPLLLLVEVPLADLGLPILVKLVIALVLVVGALLLSYDLLVRSTWIGKWLSGHRRPRVLFSRRSSVTSATTRA